MLFLRSLQKQASLSFYHSNHLSMKNLARLSLFSLSLLISSISRAQTWAAFTPQPTTSVLWDVYATSAINAWAVGNNATVLKWNGTTWTSHTLPGGIVSQRFGVWASATTSTVYVCGITTGSQLHKYDGTTWTNETAATGWGTGSMRSVWGSSDNDVWITGGANGGVGRVFRYNGSTWVNRNAGISNTYSGNRIWGLNSTHIWTVGSTGAANTGVIYKWNEATTSWDLQASGLPAIKAIWGTDINNMYAVGGNGSTAQGKIYKLSGSTWVDVTPAGTFASFYHVFGSSASNIWAAGYNGVMYKYNGTTWAAHNSGVTTDINAVASGTTNTNAVIWTAGYGDGTVNPLRTSSLTVLPLKWNSFTAQLSGNSVLLKWATAAQENTSSFEIEHADGNNNWTVIGSVNASRSTESIYAFTHYNPLKGKNNYRIRQTDIDGRSSYSSIAIVNITDAVATLQVMKNPAKNGVLQLKSTAAQSIRIFDMQGREVINQQVAAGNVHMDISRLSAGTYVVSNANGNTIQFLVK